MKKETIVHIVGCLLLLSLRGQVIPDNPEVIKHMKKETIVHIVGCLLLLSLRGPGDKKPDNPEVIKHMKKETIVHIVSCLLLSLRGQVINYFHAQLAELMSEFPIMMYLYTWFYFNKQCRL